MKNLTKCFAKRCVFSHRVSLLLPRAFLLFGLIFGQQWLCQLDGGSSRAASMAVLSPKQRAEKKKQEKKEEKAKKKQRKKGKSKGESSNNMA